METIITKDAYNILKFIDFKILYKWYVSQYINPYQIKSRFQLIELGKLLKPYKEKIKRNDYKGDFDVIAKVSFNDGKIHLRDKRETGMDLYKLKSKQLLVSKINFHQGAVAINNFDDLVCSTHYQPYNINYNLICGDFLTKVIRSVHFKKFQGYLKAEGIKNEATYEFISTLKIPLPDLQIQEKLLQYYYDKLQLAENQESQANELEKGIDEYLIKELEISRKNKSNRVKGKLYFVNFKDLQRWDTKYFLEEKYNITSRFSLLTYSDLFYSLKNGVSTRNHTKTGIRFLKVADIKNNTISNHNVFYVTEYKGTDVLNSETLLITRKGTVGQSYFVKENNEYIASSEIFIIKLKDNVIGDYVSEINLSNFIQEQYKEKSTGTIMPSLSQENLKSIIIPVPPKQKQLEILNKINI
jgi:type I restriction enzyme M protein